MEKKYFEEINVIDIENLVYIALKREYMRNNNTSTVCFIAKYEDAAKIVQTAIRDYDKVPIFLDLQYPEWNGYSKEYIIHVDVGGKHAISCEPAYFSSTGKYLYVGLENEEAEAFYILSDCNAHIVKHLSRDKVFVVVTEDDEDDEDYDKEFYGDDGDDTCKKCGLCDREESDSFVAKDTKIDRDDDGNPVSFSTTNKYHAGNLHSTVHHYFYSNNKELLKKHAEVYGVEL